jgi:hypothetical protein
MLQWVYVCIFFVFKICAAKVDEDFENKAALTYKTLKSCIRFADTRRFSFKFPKDAQKHYDELMTITEQFRGLSPHKKNSYFESTNITASYDQGGTGSSIYEQKWIENHFVDAFSKKSLTYFRGLFPLFVQWSDVQLHHKHQQQKLSGKRIKDRGGARATAYEMFRPLLKVMRKDVLYITVSQANRGLSMFTYDFPNVIVINSGGVGNIPIPLVRGNLPYQSPYNQQTNMKMKMKVKVNKNTLKPFPVDIGFYGSAGHSSSRKKVLGSIQSAVDQINNNYNQNRKKKREMIYESAMYPSPEWIVKVDNTSFVLAPRGFGRQTFRLAETIQIGRIPIYVYDDYPWLPYQDTDIDFISKPLPLTYAAPQFTLMLQKRQVTLEYIQQLSSLLEEQEQYSATSTSRLFQIYQRMAEIRHYFTYEGIIEQIDAFFHDPLNVMGTNGSGSGGNYLRCVKWSRGQAEILTDSVIL